MEIVGGRERKVGLHSLPVAGDVWPRLPLRERRLPDGLLRPSVRDYFLSSSRGTIHFHRVMSLFILIALSFRMHDFPFIGVVRSLRFASDFKHLEMFQEDFGLQGRSFLFLLRSSPARVMSLSCLLSVSLTSSIVLLGKLFIPTKNRTCRRARTREHTHTHTPLLHIKHTHTHTILHYSQPMLLPMQQDNHCNNRSFSKDQQSSVQVSISVRILSQLWRFKPTKHHHAQCRRIFYVLKVSANSRAGTIC